MPEIQIQGINFQVPTRYAEGHVLTSNEARALNQTFAENLRNNFAPWVKEKREEVETENLADDVIAGLQEELNAYAAEYEFGKRTAGGGRSVDPVMVEAMALARQAVKDAIRIQKGPEILRAVKAAQISELARQVLDKGDTTSKKLLSIAKETVEKRQAAADIDLSGVSLITNGSTDAEQAAAE